MTSNPQPRLPGFLRRSLRNPYELNESIPSSSSGKKNDEKADSTAVDATSPTSSNPSASKNNVPPSLGEEFPHGVNSFAQQSRRSTNVKSGDAEALDDLDNNSDADEKRPNDGQLYVSFPDKYPDEIVDTDGKRKQGSSRSNYLSTTEEKKELSSKGALSYKETLFEKVILAPIVNLRDLRKLGWNGIPAQYRADSWRILLGYLPANASRRSATLLRKRAEYADAITQHYNIDDAIRTLQEQETLRQVLVDVPRTAPDVGLFRNERVRRCLERILYIWAMRHPASSYVQGINDLVTPLFAVFLSGFFAGVDVSDGKILLERKGNTSNNNKDKLEGGDSAQIDNWLVPESMLSEVEADCYWCLTKLLAGIQDHYTSDQPGVQRMVARLEELVRRMDASLWNYLKNMGIEFMQFAFKWMNCLLLREFSLGCVIRLWDTYLSEGDGGFEDFHVYVCAAFLCQFSAEVQTMEFDELFGFMQNMPTEDWKDKEIEVLLSQAFVLSTLFGGSDAHLAI